jgi:hypothetical protein
MNTKFTAHWNQNQPRPDPLMTRKGAAFLLMSWRRNARKNSNYERWTLKRNGLHSFTMSCPVYPDEFYTIAWTVSPRGNV